MQNLILESDLLSRIPLSAQTILDVGCGRGELVAAYGRMNPRARLLGIEKDPAAARLAALHLAEVSTADVELDPLPFAVPDDIDCIIYNDVLHRLRDPWGLIARHMPLLSPDGILLIYGPNAEYWQSTERRLRGTWDEAVPQHGLSMSGISAALRRVSLTHCDFPVSAALSDAARRFFDAMAPILAMLGIEPEDYAKRAVRAI